MVGIEAWRKVALLALCHSCLPNCSHSASIIERDVEPTAFVTAAATSDATPLWLLLPVLLDVQPVLLKVDVTRHVPAQLQVFCREHGVDVTRCAGAIREALGKVVNFHKFCKEPTADDALPGFVVTKNVLRGGGEDASAFWLQNDPEDVAMDFCDFPGGSAGPRSDDCTKALEKALRLSFDWILHLPPCEKPSESIGDRLATVEQMIDELHSSSVEGTEPAPSEQLGGDVGSETVVGPEESDVDTDQPFFSAEPTEEGSSPISTLNNDLGEDISENISEVVEADTQQRVQDKSVQIAVPLVVNTEEEAQAPECEENQSSPIKTTQIVEHEGSCEAEYPAARDVDQCRIGEEQALKKTWKVGAALVLALSILYLAIDMMLHHVATFAQAPRQLASLMQHNMFHLVRGGPQSMLAAEYPNAIGTDDLKKPMLRKSKILPKTDLTQTGKRADNAKDSSIKSRTVEPPHHPAPSFACVAMMLMSGSHAPIQHDTFSLGADILQTSKLVQTRNTQEVAAVQRIQKLWKSSQHKVPTTTISLQVDCNSDTNAPIFRLLQLRSKKTPETPRGDSGATGFHRLVPSTLPPRR